MLSQHYDRNVVVFMSHCLILTRYLIWYPAKYSSDV